MVPEALQSVFSRFGHRRRRALLSPYIDGELPAAERAQIEAHLAACAACRVERDKLLFASRLAAWLSLPDESPTPFPRWQREQAAGLAASQSQRGKQRLVFAAAATALVLLALAAGWSFTREKSEAWEVVRLGGAPSIAANRVGQNAKMQVGEWLETDRTSRALIKVGMIGQVEVSPNTRIGLLAASPDEHRLSLAKGRIEAAIAAPPRLFFIETPSSVAIDYGCAYTLEVNDAGESLIHVTAGWVGMNLNGRESLVPAGARCRSVPGKGPGTPYLDDASEAFRAALQQIDFGAGGGEAVNTVLAEARVKDALSLWHLLGRLGGEERGRVYDRLASLVPPPGAVTREAALKLDRRALDVWKESIELASVGVAPSSIPTATGSLRPTGVLKEARYAHTATLLADGRVLVAGGVGPDDAPLTSTELYDPARGDFTASAHLLSQRAWHTATRLNDGRVLIVGGYRSTRTREVSPTAELFDPATRSFITVGQMSAARAAHRATLLADGRVLITGGQDATLLHTAGAEIYDPATRRFTPAGSLLTPRSDHTATLLKDGRVLIAGGATNGPPDSQTVAAAELYDPARNVFTPAGSLHTARAKHSAALLQDGRVLIIGGSDVQIWRGRFASAEVYDPANGTFAEVGNMSTARYKIRDAVVALRDGRILVAGGGPKVEVYDPASGVFGLVKGDLGAARHYATATLLADGRVLFAGGYASGDATGLIAGAGAWIYQP
jgi:hypothetical protein